MKKIKVIKSGSVVCGLSVKNVAAGREYELTDEEAIAAIDQGFTASVPAPADKIPGDEKSEIAEEKSEEKSEEVEAAEEVVEVAEKSTDKKKNSKKKKGAGDNA